MYITAAVYAGITGRDASEATEARLKQASLLLDTRIGYHTRQDSGWKLDMDELEGYQENAVVQWVAYMVQYLYDHGDSAPSAASVRLGRFSVTQPAEGQGLMPDTLGFADAQLVAAGMVRTRVKVT